MMSQQTLKIVTYNIHKGFSVANQRFVLHEIKHAVMETDADIVFLQEVYGEHSKWEKKLTNWPDHSQFEFIADSIWHHHAYAKNAIYESGHHGNAILSKYPFSEWENINVSLFKQASRSLLHGIIQLPGSDLPIHLICVHLGLFGFERRRQLSTLIRRIKSHVPDNEPLIIAGDFNDWLIRAEQHFHEELGITEVFKAHAGKYARSWPAWMPVLKMDRIYSRGLQIVDTRHLKGQQWRKLSDHIPLYAEFSTQVTPFRKAV